MGRANAKHKIGTWSYIPVMTPVLRNKICGPRELIDQPGWNAGFRFRARHCLKN